MLPSCLILRSEWSKTPQNRHDNNTLIKSRNLLPRINPPATATSHQPAPSSLVLAPGIRASITHLFCAIFLSLSSIHPSIHHSCLTHTQSINFILHTTPFIHLRAFRSNQHSQWLPKRHPRNPPLEARPQLVKLLPPRRRRPERRLPPLHQAKRRREARRERRLTLHTSTKVSSQFPVLGFRIPY